MMYCLNRQTMKEKINISTKKNCVIVSVRWRTMPFGHPRSRIWENLHIVIDKEYSNGVRFFAASTVAPMLYQMMSFQRSRK